MESNNSVSCVNRVESHYLPSISDKDPETHKSNNKANDSLPYIDSTKPKSNFNKPTILDISSLNSAESMDKIVTLVALSIKEIIEINKNVSNEKDYFEAKNAETSPFYSKRVPNITLEAYLQRIVKYTKMEASSLILTSIYVDRFCEKNEYFLTPHTAYR